MFINSVKEPARRDLGRLGVFTLGETIRISDFAARIQDFILDLSSRGGQFYLQRTNGKLLAASVPARGYRVWHSKPGRHSSEALGELPKHQQWASRNTQEMRKISLHGIPKYETLQLCSLIIKFCRLLQSRRWLRLRLRLHPCNL